MVPQLKIQGEANVQEFLPYPLYKWHFVTIGCLEHMCWVFVCIIINFIESFSNKIIRVCICITVHNVCACVIWTCTLPLTTYNRPLIYLYSYWMCCYFWLICNMDVILYSLILCEVEYHYNINILQTHSVLNNSLILHIFPHWKAPFIRTGKV